MLQCFRVGKMFYYHNKGIICSLISQTVAWLSNFVMYCHCMIQYSLPWQHHYDSVVAMLGVSVVIIIIVHLGLGKIQLSGKHLSSWKQCPQLCCCQNCAGLKKQYFYFAFYCAAAHTTFRITLSCIFDLFVFLRGMLLNDTDPSFIHNLSSTPGGKVPPIHFDWSQWKSSVGKGTEIWTAAPAVLNLTPVRIFHSALCVFSSPVMAKTLKITRNKVGKFKILDAIRHSNLINHVTSSHFNLESVYIIGTGYYSCYMFCFL